MQTPLGKVLAVDLDSTLTARGSTLGNGYIAKQPNGDITHVRARIEATDLGNGGIEVRPLSFLETLTEGQPISAAAAARWPRLTGMLSDTIAPPIQRFVS